MKTGRILGLVAGAVIVVGCTESTPTSTLVPDSPLFAFIGNLARPGGTTVRTAEVERVEVCKDYVMTTGATPPTANFTANGNAFTLTDGECKEVWIEGGVGIDVTVIESVIAGFTTTVKVTGVGGPVSGPTAGYSATVHPAGNPAAGFLVEYVNTEQVGCTFTQGYWKTHSIYGPAGPADDAWNLLPGGLGPNTVFFLSGQTWLAVFNTSGGGNAYYTLAKQYMAAVLNGLNGANTSSVAAAIASATTLFNTYTPAQIGALSGGNALRQQFLSLASTLESFNTGATGPGHCVE